MNFREDGKKMLENKEEHFFEGFWLKGVDGKMRVFFELRGDFFFLDMIFIFLNKFG